MVPVGRRETVCVLERGAADLQSDLPLGMCSYCTVTGVVVTRVIQCWVIAQNYLKVLREYT